MTEGVSSGGTRMLPGHRQAPFLHAGFWRRFAAYIIDSFIVGAVAGVVYVLLALVVFVPAAASHQEISTVRLIVMIGVFDLVALVGTWLYFALCESSKWQATPGKLALGLCVTDLFGHRIGFGRASGRFFGKIISGLILNIGYMMAGWTERKQALHDMLAACCVVSRDGLAAWDRGEGEAVAGGARSGGMPGWAVALIVVGVLFLAIAPLAILAAIAVPAYQSYLIRSQVAEGVSLADGAKIAIVQYVGEHGALPADNLAAGLPAPASVAGRYVSSVRVEDGQVVVTFGDHADRQITGKHLVLKPSGSIDHASWNCASPDIRDRYLPSACRQADAAD